MPKNMLFEIGTEEIPANFMTDIIKQLRVCAENELKSNRIEYQEISVFGTPRRLVIFIKDMQEKQLDNEQLIKGPTKKVAYDENGSASKALQGFLKTNEVDESSVFVNMIGKNECIFVKKFEKGRLSLDILRQVLPNILYSLSFPKSMRWGNYDMKFVRPIRWLVALLGADIIEFEIEGVQASNMSRGHRTLSNYDIQIESPEQYFHKMREAFILVDQNERERIIKEQVEVLARTKNATVLMDKDLLEEVTYLIEFPTAFMGNFEEEFLALPKDAIITPMKEHQRYFPIFKDEVLLPCFIGVRNGNEKDIDIVKAGNERVLRARLKDAEFFFNEDLKEKLESRVEKLKTIIYQVKLGTVYEKVQRFSSIGELLAEQIGISQSEKALLKRAATLCKADIVTSMVNEFDELQGIMGKEYAIRNNENPQVAEAIYSHCLPRFAGDKVPKDILGVIISISDRIDTITGSFAIGIIPSGSQDPYGLRRHAIAIINTVLENEMDFDFSELVKMSLMLLKNTLKFNEEEVLRDVLEFFKQRIRGILIDKGNKPEIVDAVMGQKISSIYDVAKKIQGFGDFIEGNNSFEGLLTALTRVINIAKKSKSKEVNLDMFESEFETELYNSIVKAEQEMRIEFDKKNYAVALHPLVALEKPINDFFDGVMVMVEDEKLRENRLALMLIIADSVKSVMNIEKLSNLK